MNFDKNTVIGFIVLGLLFVGYFFYTSKEQNAYKAEQARIDSIANANKPKINPQVAALDSQKADSIATAVASGSFYNATQGKETITKIETDLFVITFSNKGAVPKAIALKKYKTGDSALVKLAANSFDKLSYNLNTGNNSSTSSDKLLFTPGVVANLVDGSTQISFKLMTGGDSASAAVPAITHVYTIKPNNYLIDFTILAQGAANLFTQNKLNLTWSYSVAKQESDINFEKQNTQVGYLENDKYDYHTIGRRDDVKFIKPVQWLGVRQRFFNTVLIAKNKFSAGEMKWNSEVTGDKNIIVQSEATMQLDLPATQSVEIPLSIYFGPSDLHTLSKYELQLDKMVNLGQGIYAFVRPLNRYVILPVWDFIKGFVSNFGWVIACLTLFIRLLISPLTYKSYLSGAKMKALKPEIAKLKEKFGKDQQGMSMEQMKLFREAGVNPLGGCVPALFQIPIFFALYSFFNSSIDLRGANFLWANDLSAYDDLIKFGVNIPMLGSHLSLFTITATITSLLISIYSMSMTPDQGNPMMKYLPYIFPVFLLFIFNNLPSALTWYYTVSNLITLALQFIIQNYIINHDKIVAQIALNRQKPKPKSKWAERIEQMQEQQKKLKNVPTKGK